MIDRVLRTRPEKGKVLGSDTLASISMEVDAIMGERQLSSSEREKKKERICESSRKESKLV